VIDTHLSGKLLGQLQGNIALVVAKLAVIGWLDKRIHHHARERRSHSRSHNLGQRNAHVHHVIGIRVHNDLGDRRVPRRSRCSILGRLQLKLQSPHKPAWQ
jgi:hypothetical protein